MRSFDRPFIVIGCHRTGSSWLSMAMHRAGIFMGAIKDHNQEAMHFLSLNQQAMSNAGCRWDQPCVPKQSDWPTIEKRELLKIHFQEHKRRQLWWRVLKGNTQWGWKDPRNTFTLSHWLHYFPEAKVIHLTRNRDDVVKSLLARQHIPGEVQSEVQKSEKRAITLWETYTTKAREYQAHLNSRYLEVNYNRLTSTDGDALNRFCNKDVKRFLKDTEKR